MARSWPPFLTSVRVIFKRAFSGDGVSYVFSQRFFLAVCLTLSLSLFLISAIVPFFAAEWLAPSHSAVPGHDVGLRSFAPEYERSVHERQLQAEAGKEKESVNKHNMDSSGTPPSRIGKLKEELQQHRQQEDAFSPAESTKIVSDNAALESQADSSAAEDSSQSAQRDNAVDDPKATDSSANSDSDSSSRLPSTRPNYADTAKLTAVRSAFLHAYEPYESVCFPHDEFHPISRTCTDWIEVGLTALDSLDTMWLMGLHEQFNKVLNWLPRLDWSKIHRSVSVFEITIRALGGLMSAYDLSGEQIFLEKAQQLGDRLLPAFQTARGFPQSQITLGSGYSSAAQWTGGNVLLAEVGTVQVEFYALAQRTGEKKFFDIGHRIFDTLDKMDKHAYMNLYPIYISHSGQFTPSKVAFGAMGDSFYEYLLKAWLVTGKKHEQYARMYRETMRSMIDNLVSTDEKTGYTWIPDWEHGRKIDKMDHLACFAAAMLALGVQHGIVSGKDAEDHLRVAAGLTYTCFKFYDNFPTGLSPEYVRFSPEMSAGDPSYKLRPEALEAIFLMWRLTHEQKYRDWGWQIFQAIERNAKIPSGGYAQLGNVHRANSYDDKMESFFLAETLKYAFMLFSDDDVVPLWNDAKKNEAGSFFVLNTECHPIKSFDWTF